MIAFMVTFEVYITAVHEIPYITDINLSSSNSSAILRRLKTAQETPTKIERASARVVIIVEVEGKEDAW